MNRTVIVGAVALGLSVAGALAVTRPSESPVGLVLAGLLTAALLVAVAVLVRAVRAIEALAEKSAALPDATRSALEGALGALRTDLERVGAVAAEASQRAIEPLVREGMGAVAKAATQHLDAVRAAVENDVAERRRAEASAIEATTSHLREVLAKLDAAQTAQNEATASLAARLEKAETARVEKLLGAVEARGAALVGRLDALDRGLAERSTLGAERVLGELEKLGASLAERETARSEKLLGEVAALGTSLVTRESERSTRLLDAIEAARSAAQERDESRASRLLDAIESARQATAEREGERTARVLETLEKLGESLAERDTTRTESLLRELHALATTLAERDESRTTKVLAAVGSLGASLAERDAARVDSVLERIGALGTSLAESEGERSTRFLTELATLGTDLATREAERSRTLLAELGSLATTIADGDRTRSAALEALVARVDGVATHQTETLARELGAVQAELSRAAESWAAFAASSGERDAERARAVASLVERASETLETATHTVQASITSLSEAGRSEQERLGALFAELGTTAERLGEVASTHARTLEGFSQGMEQRTERLETETRARLEAFLEEARTAAELSAEQAASLEARIAAAHESQLEKLQAAVGEHEQKIGESLLAATETLRESASLVHAGGAELTVVAETFAASVAAHREAATEWLSQLGRVEAAVAAAGETAAADALGQHLAQTHELFEKQLRFQNELFEQLRTFREARVANEESSPGVVPAADAGEPLEGATDAAE